MTVFTSRQFNQEASRAKREANDGPVFITDRGRPGHVLITMEEYQRLTKPKGPSLAERLGMDGPYFEWEPPRLDLTIEPFEFD